MILSEPKTSFQRKKNVNFGHIRDWSGRGQTTYFICTVFCVCLFREVRVHLICDKNFGTGREKLTTTGDTESVLNYVSEWAKFFSLLIGI